MTSGRKSLARFVCFLTVILHGGLVPANTRGASADDSQPDHAGGGEAFIEALGLAQMTVGPLRVFYGPGLAGKLDEVRPIFERIGRQFERDGERTSDLLGQSEAIVRDVNRLVGWEEAEIEFQKQLFAGFLTNAALHSLVLQDPRVFLVPKNETKRYLRQGGRIPGVSFDPATGQAQIEFGRGWRSAGPATNAPAHFIFPADGLEDIAEVAAVFEGVSSTVAPLVFHELVEVTMLKRLKPPDPSFRWFSDGFANAVSEILLRKFISADAAKAFANVNTVEPYQDLKPALLLRYWLGKAYCVQTSFEPEARLNQARYNFATLEARSILETYGEETLKKTLDLVCAGSDSASRIEPAAVSERLLKALERVTGENMQGRFQAYEPFRSLPEGLQQYQNALSEADAKVDHGAALSAILRLLELRTARDGRVHVDSYREAALRLNSMGRAEEALALFQDCARNAAGNVELVRQIQRDLVRMAWMAGRPEFAGPASEELLAVSPRDAAALSIRMELLWREGSHTEARRVADQILAHASPDDRLFLSLAQFSIAVSFVQGRGMEKDLKQAREWFARAAANGHAVAARNLAVLHLKGEGGPQDREQAIDWLRRAADLGDAEAKRVLGSWH